MEARVVFFFFYFSILTETMLAWSYWCSIKGYVDVLSNGCASLSTSPVWYIREREEGGMRGGNIMLKQQRLGGT